MDQYQPSPTMSTASKVSIVVGAIVVVLFLILSMMWALEDPLVYGAELSRYALMVMTEFEVLDTSGTNIARSGTLTDSGNSHNYDVTRVNDGVKLDAKAYLERTTSMTSPGEEIYHGALGKKGNENNWIKLVFAHPIRFSQIGKIQVFNRAFDRHTTYTSALTRSQVQLLGADMKPLQSRYKKDNYLYKHEQNTTGVPLIVYYTK